MCIRYSHGEHLVHVQKQKQTISSSMVVLKQKKNVIKAIRLYYSQLYCNKTEFQTLPFVFQICLIFIFIKEHAINNQFLDFFFYKRHSDSFNLQ